MQDIVSIDPSWSHRVFQDFYMLPERAGLFPSRIYVRPCGADGVEEYFRTNSWGLKGEEPDGRPVAVVWGDSVVFGNGPSWAEKLGIHFPHVQFMNGGIEGDFPDNIITRMLRMNAAHALAANIFMPGWHVRGASTSIAPLLDGVFAKKIIPRALLLTLPSALSPATAAQDWAPHFQEGTGDDAFTFFGPVDYSVPRAQAMLAFVQRRNDELRACAAGCGLPLLDLFPHFQFADVAKAKTVFSDICHPRPVAYDHLAVTVAGMLKGFL